MNVELKSFIFTVSGGHAGCLAAVLDRIIERKVRTAISLVCRFVPQVTNMRLQKLVRKVQNSRSDVITLEAFNHHFFRLLGGKGLRNELLTDPFSRGIPSKKELLASNLPSVINGLPVSVPEICRALRSAASFRYITDSGIGQELHKRGWLYASKLPGLGSVVYRVPSPLHAW